MVLQSSRSNTVEENAQLLTHRVIAKKPNDKSPEVTHALPGFLVYHLFSDPVSESLP